MLVTACLLNLIVSRPASAAEIDYAVERQAAEAVLKLGGVVAVNAKGPSIEVKPGGALPTERFVVWRIDFLKGQGIDDSTLAFVPKLSALRNLYLNGSAVGDAFLAQVARLPTIEVLHLSGTLVTDVGLESLSQHKKLNAIFLNGTFTTDRGAASLAKITTIRTIHIANTKLTDAGLAELARLPELVDCTVEGNAVTDAGVAKLKACPNLEILRVNRTEVSDAGIEFLKGSPKLQILEGRLSKFTDGIATVVVDCPKLRILDLSETKVTEATAKRLKTSLSKCDVRWLPPKVEPPTPAPATTPKAPVVYVDVAKDFHTNVAVAAEKLLQAGEFEKLDAVTEKYRDSKELFPNGSWKTTRLYSYLARPSDVRSDLQWNAHIKQCEEWREARPNSTAAAIVLARAWRNYAWQARGEGYASSITIADGQKFSERLQKCAEVLNASEWTAEKDPEWFKLAVSMQKEFGGNGEKVRELCKKSLELHPTFPETVVTAATFFYPRWHGKPGELEAFAEQVVEWTQKTSGKMFYAWIAFDAQNLHGYHVVQALHFSWDTIKQGFEDWQSRFPSDRRLQVYCRMACVYRDRATAARLFDTIVGPYDMELWYSQPFIDMQKTWASPSFENGDQRQVLAPFALGVGGVGWTTGHSATIRALSDRPMLVRIDSERISLVATETGKVTDVAQTPYNAAVMGIDPNSSDVFVTTRDREIFKTSWDGADPEKLCTTETPVGTMSVVGRPPLLVVSGDDGVIQLLRSTDGRVQGKVKLEGKRMSSIDSSSSADLVVIGTEDGFLLPYSLGTQAPAEPWKVHGESVHDVSFSPDGKLLVTCSQKEIKLWNVADRKLLGTLEGPQGTAMFKFTSDNSILVGATSWPVAGNYRIAFWNVAERKLLKLATGHKGHISSLAISPDDKTVATSSHDTSIRLWDVPRPSTR